MQSKYPTQVEMITPRRSKQARTHKT